MSLSLEKEMEEDHVIENIFRKAKTHTNWGRDFRVQWDAETKKARTDLVSKENEDIEMQLLKFVMQGYPYHQRIISSMPWYEQETNQDT